MATIGTVTYPTSTTAEVEVSGIPLGSTVSLRVSSSDGQTFDLSVEGRDNHLIRATVAAAYDEATVEFILAEQDGTEAEASAASDGYEVGLTLGMRQGESVRAFEGETLGLRYGVQQGESVRATDAASGPLLDAVHVIRASCGASYDDATVSLVLAAQVGQALEAAIASDACAASIRAAAGQAESAIALDRLLGHRVKIKGPTGPRVPPWWKRHSRGGRLWSK